VQAERCHEAVDQPARSRHLGRPQRFRLRRLPWKCLHIDHDDQHSIFGFCNVRIQTWFPFNVQICINGREWLARQLTEQGAQFRRDDNCIFWADDIPAAQRLFDEQLRQN
jgi:hypothetical protein